jgi:hypothetical protein
VFTGAEPVDLQEINAIGLASQDATAFSGVMSASLILVAISARSR